MEIIRLNDDDKRKYLDLLLTADEQESMGVKAECVVTKEAEGVYELKNIAVISGCRRRGYGKKLIDFLFFRYPDCRTLLVGTGDVPSTLGFYRRCGFTESHRVKNFFTDNYDHPIFEDGRQLADMVYLKRER